MNHQIKINEINSQVGGLRVDGLRIDGWRVDGMKVLRTRDQVLRSWGRRLVQDWAAAWTDAGISLLGCRPTWSWRTPAAESSPAAAPPPTHRRYLKTTMSFLWHSTDTTLTWHITPFSHQKTPTRSYSIWIFQKIDMSFLCHFYVMKMTPLWHQKPQLNDI